jgi:hypothetical protein
MIILLQVLLSSAVGFRDEKPIPPSHGLRSISSSPNLQDPDDVRKFMLMSPPAAAIADGSSNVLVVSASRWITACSASNMTFSPALVTASVSALASSSFVTLLSNPCCAEC